MVEQGCIVPADTFSFSARGNYNCLMQHFWSLIPRLFITSYTAGQWSGNEFTP